MQRRQLLRGSAAAAPLAALYLSGLLPRPLLAAWPDQAFHAEELAAAHTDLFGDRTVEDSDAIAITAPDIAENGRVVPVEVSIDLPAPERLALFSDANPFPLLAQAHFTAAVEPRLSVRVKLGQSANLIALVEADGKLYRASRAVKVTSGGCGG
jgi:sulfur-oxidizing protein SoxY